jgi:hypothetical protein
VTATGAADHATPASGTDEARWHAAWVAALDELEGTLVDTERLLGGEVHDADLERVGWTPPDLPVPLPGDLVARATLLAARQRVLVTEATAAVAGSRRQADLLGRMRELAGAAVPQRPVYVDVTA